MAKCATISSFIQVNIYLKEPHIPELVVLIIHCFTTSDLANNCKPFSDVGWPTLRSIELWPYSILN